MMKLLDKQNCTSCMACYSSCPVNAIKIIKDGDGFYYPEIDTSKCIKCGLCENRCPIRNFDNNKFDNHNLNIREIYACTNKDNEIRKKSSSGGLFYALAQYILSQDGYV